MQPRTESPAQGDLSELFHRAFRALRHSWVEQLAPFELTPHQFRAMQALARTSLDSPGGEGLRLKDVAERLHIAPRSATEVMDQLEAKSLVQRAADPVDRRATLVKLTPEGQKLSDRVRAARRGHTEQYFGRLNANDRAELARILAQLGPM
ncbi:MarR family winged helix-turn-helix transcriptional regulator [Paeniglutamicibacter kerguelensis]|uniref:DNA-binding MarR family transcriptional regulator n=1 Tax=Paeniglutamicibacter kerguelensis TaxID=254788 RepID=A0ABS4XFT9_9MICC|nr:MarR family transcriptional regulator [Paeniglutamicibacter kerguelensis]MBP2387329.1 DNA-binding MarR family transcriptional regulator [Paeniglutamicibacter kerguelensis]